MQQRPPPRLPCSGSPRLCPALCYGHHGGRVIQCPCRRARRGRGCSSRRGVTVTGRGAQMTDPDSCGGAASPSAADDPCLGSSPPSGQLATVIPPPFTGPRSQNSTPRRAAVAVAAAAAAALATAAAAAAAEDAVFVPVDHPCMHCGGRDDDVIMYICDYPDPVTGAPCNRGLHTTCMSADDATKLPPVGPAGDLLPWFCPIHNHEHLLRLLPNDWQPPRPPPTAATCRDCTGPRPSDRRRKTCDACRANRTGPARGRPGRETAAGVIPP